MGLLDVVGRSVAALGTGGLSEVVVAVVENEADTAPPQNQKAPGDKGSDKESGKGSDKGCCQRYQLADHFLLDTQSGRVWRFDEKTTRFEIVERVKTTVEKNLEAILRVKLEAQLAEQLNVFVAEQAAKEAAEAHDQKTSQVMAAISNVLKKMADAEEKDFENLRG